MSVIEKAWGTTEPLLVTPLFEMHRLVIRPRHRCSFHMHRIKHNAFYILSGALMIDSALGDMGLGVSVESSPLSQGMTYTIAPGVYHQFRTGEDSCTALEMYYTEPLSEDIVRLKLGGPI
jgi:mannose-6-phosphate isomerase-like protein (cupin superfamily)